jgi:hypothetical protein
MTHYQTGQIPPDLPSWERQFAMRIGTDQNSRWFESAWFTKTVTYGFALLVLVKFVHSVFPKENDFDWHLAYGRLVLDATHFNNAQAFRSLVFHYRPGRMLFDEAVSLLPRLLARTIATLCQN